MASNRPFRSFYVSKSAVKTIASYCLIQKITRSDVVNRVLFNLGLEDFKKGEFSGAPVKKNSKQLGILISDENFDRLKSVATQLTQHTGEYYSQARVIDFILRNVKNFLINSVDNEI